MDTQVDQLYKPKMKATAHFIYSFLCLMIHLTTSVCGQVKLTVNAQYDPVSINGTRWLYYELLISNRGTAPVNILNFKVKGKNGQTIVDLSGGDLQARLKTKLLNNKLAPGTGTFVYMEVPEMGRDLNPLNNILTYIPDGDHTVQTVSVSTQLINKQPLLIGSPLSGDNWAAIYDPAWERGHRRVFFTVDGTYRIPGRFAIDFIKLDSSGRFAKGSQDSIKNWYGYGADVLAVENGIIAATVDTFKESQTLSAHPAYDSSRATGNYIAIKIAPNIFAFYEHLKPGSISVKVGNRVKAGQVIASIGFTGQSTGPHLHFHLADRNSPLGAEGIPYGFKKFVKIGTYQNFEDFGKKRWSPLPHTSNNVGIGLPASNSILSF